MLSPVLDFTQAVASIATAVGVAVAAYQLRVTKIQNQSQFEDRLNEQYRRIIKDVPVEALLGQPLPKDELPQRRRSFYDYFDLSNEQAFLASKKRLRPETWENWEEGIRQHMNRPAFQQAWVDLAPSLDGSFDDLRRLLPPSLHVVRHTPPG